MKSVLFSLIFISALNVSSALATTETSDVFVFKGNPEDPLNKNKQKPANDEKKKAETKPASSKKMNSSKMIREDIR